VTIKGILTHRTMKIGSTVLLPFLLATVSIALTNHEALAQGFGRRLGLADFATNDLLRHARASTSSDETEYPSTESRQLPYQQQAPSRQRALRPILRKSSPKSRHTSNRNRPNREESSNFVRDGARYDNNGNRIKRPTSNQVPRQNVQHLLIPKQGPKQSRPIRKIQKKGYPQNLPKPLARRGQAKPIEKKFLDQQRLELLATPDAGQVASSSQQSFVPQRSPNRERYSQQNDRPSYNYKNSFSEYDEAPTESTIRRRVDPNLEAVIEDVVPNSYSRDRAQNDYRQVEEPINEQNYPSNPPEDYKVSSAPAFGSPSNRRETYAESPYGYQIPAEQKNLQAAVASGADAYGQYANRQNIEGVYQNEDRLSFQIHGHDGPDSYRYGYDTGHGYNRQFRYEEKDGKGQLKGRYGFFDVDGELKVVNYSADPYAGFHAEGDGIPQYPH